MTPDALKKRTKQFGLRVIRLVESLPKTKTASTIGGQLLRCGTSVGANYRAACRGRSKAEFIAKLGVVEEEADESAFWIEMLVEAKIIKIRNGKRITYRGRRIDCDYGQIPYDRKTEMIKSSD